jgi:hypothetical protein
VGDYHAASKIVEDSGQGVDRIGLTFRV